MAGNDTCKYDRTPQAPQQIPLPAPCALLMGNSAMHWPKLSERKRKEKTIMKKKSETTKLVSQQFFKESLPLENFYSKRFHTFFERGKYSVLS